MERVNTVVSEQSDELNNMFQNQVINSDNKRYKMILPPSLRINSEINSKVLQDNLNQLKGIKSNMKSMYEYKHNLAFNDLKLYNDEVYISVDADVSKPATIRRMSRLPQITPNSKANYKLANQFSMDSKRRINFSLSKVKHKFQNQSNISSATINDQNLNDKNNIENMKRNRYNKSVNIIQQINQQSNSSIANPSGNIMLSHFNQLLPQKLQNSK